MSIDIDLVHDVYVNPLVCLFEVAESEAFKSVKAKADKAIDEVKKSDAYNKAKEGIKKGC
eukprot:1389928-Amorphochlora_amoeboformis.AAC.1